MKKKSKLPIGLSDFQEMIERDYYYIDKSLFLKELMDDGSKILLIPRPRRFGKTLNMSMIQNFFQKSEESKKYLFEDLKINKEKDIMEMQGKYPVISFSFKDIKELKWESCIYKIKTLLSQEYQKNIFLLESGVLNELEKEMFKKTSLRRASQEDYENSLGKLIEYLYRYYNKKVILLIDEYDMPIQAGYMNKYYDEIVGFMRNFLSGGLKDNNSLEKGVLTGILRVSKESIFSGLNNLKVCTLLTENYADRFGLTEKEVEKIIDYYEIKEKLEDIKEWYNGYIFGGKVIYNPWSILNFIDNKMLKPYWVNTSSNDIIKELLTTAGENIKKDMEKLIMGENLEKQIDENIVFADIAKKDEAIWSFLLFSGYLKASNVRMKDKKMYCDIAIPNSEVEYLYEDIIINWFDENMSGEDEKYMLKSLKEGDIKLFSKIFKKYVENSFSFFDIGGKEPEKFYHAFVLGLLVNMQKTHYIKSNRESGYGRYDVMLIPKDKTGVGVIFEFKKIDKYDEETIKEALEMALKQIEEKKYRFELEERGIKQIKEVGIVFEGKKVEIGFK